MEGGALSSVGWKQSFILKQNSLLDNRKLVAIVLNGGFGKWEKDQRFYCENAVAKHHPAAGIDEKWLL